MDLVLRWRKWEIIGIKKEEEDDKEETDDEESGEDEKESESECEVDKENRDLPPIERTKIRVTKRNEESEKLQRLTNSGQ